jgi:hypothetical protein
MARAAAGAPVTGAAAAAAALLLLLLAPAPAAGAVIQHDNSKVCVSTLPACNAKCGGRDYFYICASGNGPLGSPYIICRCAQPAPAVGGPQQSARLVLDPQIGWPGSKAW